MFGVGFLIFILYVIFLVWNIVYNGNKQQEENYPTLSRIDDIIDMDGIGNQGRVPTNEKNKFKINQLFRELTKNKKKQEIILKIKGRSFSIRNFYDGVAKFDFKDLCDVNLGAEDFIEIANKCK